MIFYNSLHNAQNFHRTANLICFGWTLSIIRKKCRPYCEGIGGRISYLGGCCGGGCQPPDGNVVGNPEGMVVGNVLGRVDGIAVGQAHGCWAPG